LHASWAFECLARIDEARDAVQKAEAARDKREEANIEKVR
jgi:hypothetical protein